MKNIKVSILVPGRLHAFDMAIHFQQHGLLHELVTGYPKRIVERFGINRQFVKSIYINELINRGTQALGLGFPLDFLACEAYDWIASKTIKMDSDVYFIWSGYALRTIPVIRKKNPNAKIVLVRGSAHILSQENLLKLVDPSNQQPINKKIVAKECQEYELADYITVPSTFALNSFIEHGFNPNKVFNNILGVDLNSFPFTKNQTDFSSTTLNIGYVGAISNQKNVKGIVDVVDKLVKEGADIKLHVAGTFDANYPYKDLFENKPHIQYYNHIPQDQLYTFYQKVDVFILNSVQDGFGMVLLQAMSSGCAIIATENTGGPDVIKNYNNGILIPILNNQKLEEAIIWYINHKDQILQMGAKNRELTTKGFSWEDFGNRNLKFLHKITQSHSF